MTCIYNCCLIKTWIKYLNVPAFAISVLGLFVCTFWWLFKWSIRWKTFPQVLHWKVSAPSLCCSRWCRLKLSLLLKVLWHLSDFKDTGWVFKIFPSPPKCDFRWVFMWSSWEKDFPQISQTESWSPFLCWVRTWRFRLKARSKVASQCPHLCCLICFGAIVLYYRYLCTIRRVIKVWYMHCILQVRNWLKSDWLLRCQTANWYLINVGIVFKDNRLLWDSRKCQDLFELVLIGVNYVNYLNNVTSAKSPWLCIWRDQSTLSAEIFHLDQQI